MRILRFIFRYSPITAVLAAIAGTLSGALSAGLVAVITAAVSLDDPATATKLFPRFLFFSLLFPVASVAMQYLVARLGQGAISELRKSLTRRILKTPLRRLEELGSHRLLVALHSDISNTSGAVMALPIVWMNMTFLGGLLAYLAWLSWQNFLILVAFMLVASVTYRLSAIKAIGMMRKVRQMTDGLFEYFRGLTSGTKELQLHRHRRNSYLEGFDSTTESLRSTSIGATTLYMAAGSWSHFLLLMSIAFMVFYLPSVQTVDKQVIATYALTLLYLAGILRMLVDRGAAVGQANVALDNLEKLGLSLEEGDLLQGAKQEATSPNWTTLELVGVTHVYHQENEPDSSFALGPIDLEFRPGEVVILAGGNGSGKTTLAKLIVGLYTPESGEIRFDGQPVTAESLEAYRQHFSVVFYDFFLFDSLLGLDSDGLDQRALDYLTDLKLDNKVKIEDGVFSTTDLSQGQRKRLALLTSFLEDREIYVFDEWAADQDPEFKKIFYFKILPELKARGKAVIAISHDEHYYHAADRVVRLDYGKLEETDERYEDVSPSNIREAEPLAADR